MSMSETIRTYINVVVMTAVAIILGMLFGDSIRYFLGTNPDAVATNAFNDRMSLVKEIFTEEMDTFQVTTPGLVNGEYEDFRVIRNKNGNYKVVHADGTVTDLSFFDAEIADSIVYLFETQSDAVRNSADYAGDPITDVAMELLTFKKDATTMDEVKFYYYSSEHGYIAVIYADKDSITNRMDIVTLSTLDDYDDGWGIEYSFTE